MEDIHARTPLTAAITNSLAGMTGVERRLGNALPCRFFAFINLYSLLL